MLTHLLILAGNDCYICSDDSSICVVSTEECDLHCPYDYYCKHGVKQRNAACATAANVTIFYFIVALFVFLFWKAKCG